nr:DMT family transporter [Alkalihalobacterium bogoriense]
MNKQNRWIGFVLVLLGASFWGIGGTVAQRLFQESHVPVEWLVSVRLLLAGIVMIILALLFKTREKVFQIWKDKQAVFQLFIFGIFGMLAVQYTYMASINLGNAAVATLLQYQAPLFIIFYLVLTKVSKLRGKDIVAVCLALSGSLLLLTNGVFHTLSVPLASVIWGILSGVALAFYTLYAGNLLSKWGSLNIIGWAMIIGGASLAILHPPWKIEATHWGGDTIIYLGFVIVFGTMLAFWFYLESLKYLKPQETSLLGSVEPLAAIITSVLWLNISFGFYQVIGTVFILAMVLYLSLTKEKETVSTPQVIIKHKKLS